MARHHLDAADKELLDWWVDEYKTTRSGMWFENALKVHTRRYTKNARNSHDALCELRTLAKPESKGGAGLLDRMRSLITKTRLETHGQTTATNAARRLAFTQRLAAMRTTHLRTHRLEAIRYAMTDVALDLQHDMHVQSVVALEHAAMGSPEESETDRILWRTHLQTIGLCMHSDDSDDSASDASDASDDTYPSSMLSDS